MKTLTQDNRQLNITTPLGKDFLLIQRLRAQEGVSRLFRYEMELWREEDEAGHEPTVVDPKKILGQAVSIRLDQRDGQKRFFNGIVAEFAQGQRNIRFSHYYAVVVPQIWILTQISQSRIFQQTSVPDILKKVFADFKVGFELNGGAYKPREFCVQYRETDFDFASRIMEEEGIYYYFEHTENGEHKLIIADSPQSHRDCPGKSEIDFALKVDAEEIYATAVNSWQLRHHHQTGKYTLWDYHFQLPNNKLEYTQTTGFNVGNNQKLEIYDYPGGYAERYDGIDKIGGEQSSQLNNVFDDRQRTAKMRMEELDARYKIVNGASNCAALTAGYRFKLRNHPVKENNMHHVLIVVNHDAVQSPAYQTGELNESEYNNSFTCLPHGAGQVQFRPPRMTSKPVIQGSQTAMVVGPPGEEIFTDKYGRVKVQFHWDRDGQYDSRSSCWLRVAQSVAGNKWGSFHLPRIGQEVIVSFLEGNPDKPIITGSVYNPETMPPYPLPAEKTKTVLFKSHSSKGGDGFNELRIEDKKGSEQIFIHGEKNLDVRIKNDSMETIEGNRHLIINKNQHEKVSADKHLQVSGDKNEKIGGSVSLNAVHDIHEKAGMNYALDAGMEIHLKSGMNLVIETGTSLTLKVGGNFININQSGIYIHGTMVMLNSGGAAGSGAGSKPDAPQDPSEAGRAQTGLLSPPRRPTKLGPTALGLRQAAKNGTAFCEICSRS